MNDLRRAVSAPFVIVGLALILVGAYLFGGRAHTAYVLHGMCRGLCG